VRTATTGQGGGKGLRGVEAAQRWVYRARMRLELASGEWRGRAIEWQDRARAWRCCLQDEWRKARPKESASLSVNAGLEHMHAKWRRVNSSFDDWVNTNWAKLEKRLRESRDQLKQRLRDGQSSSPMPLDTTAMVLLGAGAGSVSQGYWKTGTILAVWGLARATRRFVVQKVDTDDMVGLFRWAPAKLRQRRQELFSQLKREVHAARAIRAGDPAFIGASFRSRPEGRAMDPRFDHTPESLFNEAMASVAAHPRVQGFLGPEVRALEEPESVVYRLHEGVAEVCLGWRVAGGLGTAEVQTKATASIVDFIYIFPLTTDRYGLRKPGFVIRPQGNWSMDCSELPQDMKQPFGKHGGKLFRHRQGIFEYDEEIRDFRHGYEDHPRKKRRAWW